MTYTRFREKASQVQSINKSVVLLAYLVARVCYFRHVQNEAGALYIHLVALSLPYTRDIGLSREQPERCHQHM